MTLCLPQIFGILEKLQTYMVWVLLTCEIFWKYCEYGYSIWSLFGTIGLLTQLKYWCGVDFMQEIVVSYKYIIMYFLPLRLSLLLLSSHHLLPTAPSSSSSSFGPWLRLSSSSSSAGKESACNARDPSSILGSGRSLGERIGYLFQYSWASLVAQMIKNPPAMREIWVWSLGWEDFLEERTWHPTPVFLPGESAWTVQPVKLQSMRSQSQTQLND